MAFHLRKVLVSSTLRSCISKQSRRALTCLEHQGLQLLKQSGVAVPEHVIIKDLSNMRDGLSQIGGDDFVIKALVKTGGRGLGVFDSGLKGGVQIVCSQDEAEEMAKKMLGFKLTTKQTGDQGILCDQLLLAKRHFLRREYYFSITMDRAYSGPVLIACAHGGMSIEEIAKKDPDAIICIPIDLETGVTDSQVDIAISKMGISQNCRNQAYNIIKKIFDLFISKDCSLLEINPLAEDNTTQLICMDCKLVIDDAAYYRQKELFDQFKNEEISEQEVLAKQYNLNFIPLDGNIGCLVNGAGLAMATMDIIKLHGGTPANFLDVGGGATIEQVKAAFSIVCRDPKVRAILVNIFGGILRCDVIASGVCQAAKELKISVPIVCRLMGTKVDDAKALIASSDLKVLAVDNLDEAAKMSVRLASIMDMAREVAVGVSFELPI